MKSKNVVVIDPSWGDCGKARIVDYLAQKSARVCRFNGSSNAGHTVYTDAGNKVVFHLVPAGVLHPGVVNYITNGVYVNAIELVKEIKDLQGMGIDVSPRNLRISGNCHVIGESHKKADAAEEERRGDKKLGTTKKGVGPAAVSKYERAGMRLFELPNAEITSSSFVTEFLEPYEFLRPFICDTSLELDSRVQTERPIDMLFEGAQAAFLDIDHGSYPFVTSGNCVAQYAAVSAGIPAKDLHTVIGVVKAYSTRVGAGPFPTLMGGDFEESFRQSAHEFGATTGRPRKCGWLDLPALRYGIRVNGVDELALTRIDTLAGLDEVKVCTHYTIDGKDFREVPLDHSLMFKAIPNYTSLKGWEMNGNGIPQAAYDYVNFIEQSAGKPVKYISYGPKTNDMVER